MLVLYAGTGGPYNPQCMLTLMADTNQAAVASLMYAVDQRHQNRFVMFCMMTYRFEFGDIFAFDSSSQPVTGSPNGRSCRCATSSRSYVSVCS